MGGAMNTCPYCGFENIPGEDICDQCGHSLSSFHPPRPTSELERCLVKDRLTELGPRSPIVVEPSMPVRQVLRMMVDYRIGCVLIVQDSRVIGIFTERDALSKLNERADELADRPVKEFMTNSPQTLDTNSKIAFAVQRMDQGGYRHVPIVDAQGRATGVISVRDILRYLTKRMAVES
jgi:CBS domain-containing protein